VNGLLNTYLDIIRLRAGPQDLPASWSLTLVLIAGYLMLGAFTGQRLGEGDAAGASLAITVLQFSAIIVMLQVRKYPERLAQTLSALAGVGILFGILSFIFLSQADPGKQQPILALAWFSLFFWSLVVDANIYRNALSITMAQGMLIAVMLLAASYVLVEFTFN
jgi:hypothetical protein